MYIQVNFGRNIGNLPMNSEAWQSLDSELMSAIIACVQALCVSDDVDDSIIERHLGVGLWVGADADEESTHLSTFVHSADIKAEDKGVQAMTQLSREIRRIAEWYCQDAIALITSSRLIKGDQNNLGRTFTAQSRGLL